MEVLQTSALPLGYVAADERWNLTSRIRERPGFRARSAFANSRTDRERHRSGFVGPECQGRDHDGTEAVLPCQ